MAKQIPPGNYNGVIVGGSPDDFQVNVFTSIGVFRFVQPIKEEIEEDPMTNEELKEALKSDRRSVRTLAIIKWIAEQGQQYTMKAHDIALWGEQTTAVILQCIKRKTLWNSAVWQAAIEGKIGWGATYTICKLPRNEQAAWLDQNWSSEETAQELAARVLARMAKIQEEQKAARACHEKKIEKVNNDYDAAVEKGKAAILKWMLVYHNMVTIGMVEWIKFTTHSGEYYEAEFKRLEAKETEITIRFWVDTPSHKLEVRVFRPDLEATKHLGNYINL